MSAQNQQSINNVIHLFNSQCNTTQYILKHTLKYQSL